MPIQPFSSVHKFIDPIRYFKANDPYYYEVDNIPLKQLQENCNFLKDQIDGLAGGMFPTGGGGGGGGGSLSAVTRENFDELRPYVDGTDNKVYVKPGRYTARINDAYNLTPLQLIEKLSGSEAGAVNEFNFISNQSLVETIRKFKTKLIENSLMMNGLFERSFTRPSGDDATGSQYNVSSLNQQNLGSPGLVTLPYPQLWGHTNPINFPGGTSTLFRPAYLTSTWTGLPTNGFLSTQFHEEQFIKRWRGIARTSIVNVEQTLSIEIPEFIDEDFYYIDENDQRQTIAESEQRIDLIFIYSKPIDTSSTTIAKFSSNGEPITITAPTLGIVKGAGLGLNFKKFENPSVQSSPQGGNANQTTDTAIIQTLISDGIQSIIPSVGDQVGQNIGIGNIKGSFPSPDDLMNLSPLIVNELESQNIALIGQSILPVAYVVRRRTVPGIIPISDLIDIRPFFRTTELSYNERAGIAAAVPPLSIANPAASLNYVNTEVKQVKDNLSNQITTVETNLTQTVLNAPRIIKSGYIQGGLWFGVEGVLLNFLNDKQFSHRTMQSNPPGSTQGLSQLRQKFSYPDGLQFSQKPDWDPAEWGNVIQAGGASYNNTNYGLTAVPFGQAECDWINYSISRNRLDFYGATLGTVPPLAGGPFPPGVPNTTTSRRGFTQYGWGVSGIDGVTSPYYSTGSIGTGLAPYKARNNTFGQSVPYRGGTGEITTNLPLNNLGVDEGAFYSFCYVKKTFRVRLSPGIADVKINARLFNCCPMSYSSKYGFEIGGNNSLTSVQKNKFNPAAKFSNIWSSKKRVGDEIELTVFVSWGIDMHSGNNGTDALTNLGTGLVTPSFNRARGDYFAGFMVMTEDMASLKDRNNLNEFWYLGGPQATGASTAVPNLTALAEMMGSPIGVSIYPTIEFDIIAIPQAADPSRNYGENLPLIEI